VFIGKSRMLESISMY